MFAISGKHGDIVKDLLDRGADINAKSQSEHQDLTASDLRPSL
jgi:ankyrin repeat protein